MPPVKEHYKENNYAFIDGQNMYANVLNQGWQIDYAKLQIYLKEKYCVNKIYIFMGYIERNRYFYQYLERNGFVIIFKEISYIPGGRIKGNCDAEIVLGICLRFWDFDKAVIISGDGDFYSMAEILNNIGKLECVIAPDIHTFSAKYYELRGNKVACLNDLRDLLKNKKASQENL